MLGIILHLINIVMYYVYSVRRPCLSIYSIV